MDSSSSLKGAVSFAFKIVLIGLLMVFLISVWLLLNQSFADYVVDNINSEENFCETFESHPLFGRIECGS